MRAGRKQHNYYIVYNFEKVQITITKILSSGSISIKSQRR
jgi:hypothetical protein